jgi:hypothetical protein
MEEEIIRVVATAAAGLIVRAMGTAGWRAVRGRWSHVLGRGDRDQEEVVVAQMDDSASVLAAADPDRREQLASELEAEWRGALRVQLRLDPGLVEAVRALVEAHPPTARTVVHSVEQTAKVGSGTSIQSGRDTHVGIPAPDFRRT